MTNTCPFLAVQGVIGVGYTNGRAAVTSNGAEIAWSNGSGVNSCDDMYNRRIGENTTSEWRWDVGRAC